MKKNGLSLIEVLVALAIFSAAMTAATGVFVAIQDAWRRQKMTLELIQNGRWAMEFMSNEIRTASSDGHPGYNKIKNQGQGKLVFGIDTNGDNTLDTQIKYELSGTTMVRSQKVDGPGGSFSAPVEIVNHVVNPNPSGNKIFGGDKKAGFIEIELTLRPDPLSAEGFGNRNITFRSAAIARND